MKQKPERPEWAKDPKFCEKLQEDGLIQEAALTLHDPKWVQMWEDFGGKPKPAPKPKKKASKKASSRKPPPMPTDDTEDGDPIEG